MSLTRKSLFAIIHVVPQQIASTSVPMSSAFASGRPIVGRVERRKRAAEYGSAQSSLLGHMPWPTTHYLYTSAHDNREYFRPEPQGASGASKATSGGFADLIWLREAGASSIKIAHPVHRSMRMLRGSCPEGPSNKVTVSRKTERLI